MLTILLLLLAAAAALLTALHFSIESKMCRLRHVETHERIPGARGIFLVLQLLRHHWNRRREQPLLAEIALQPEAKVGGMWGGLLFTYPVLWLNDCESAKWVLKQEEDFARIRPKSSFFDRVLMSSLLDVRGQEWEKQRRLMSAAFHHDDLLAMLPTFLDKSNKVVEIARHEAEKGPIEVTRLMSKATLDIIGAVAFGQDFNALSEFGGTEHAVKTAYEKVIQEFSNGMRFIEAYNKLRTAHNIEAEKYVDDFNRYIDDIVRRKRDTTADVKERLDVMDRLVRANDGGTLTDRELADNAKLFYVAGHETSASALGFTIGSLAEHPQLQERLYQEVLEALGDREPSAESIKELPFLTNCIKETLRLHSPAPVLFRVTSKDLVINNYEVPKGTHIRLSVRSLHLSPEYWEHPLRYDPDRFQKKLAHPFAYIPFGAASRVCLGQHLAMLEMRVILAKLVQTFSFKAVAGNPLRNDSSFILRPPLDYRVEFVLRKHAA